MDSLGEQVLQRIDAARAMAWRVRATRTAAALQQVAHVFTDEYVATESRPQHVPSCRECEQVLGMPHKSNCGKRFNGVPQVVYSDCLETDE